jgi:hypothetical protein
MLLASNTGEDRMTDIQQDDVTENNQAPEKIYEDEQYVVNDEGQVVLAANPEESEEAKKDGKAKLPEIHISEIATVTCQADLDRILADHREWADAVLNPKAETAKGRANLIGADLRPYDLSGKNLSGANLSGANLQGVDLVNANLTATNFENADLRCANLRGAKMIRTKVNGADLRGADLTNALLMSTDLTTAILKSPDEPTAKAGATADDVQDDELLPAGDDAVKAEHADSPDELVLEQIDMPDSPASEL